MNKNTRGFGFYLLAGLMFVMLVFSLKNSFMNRSDITYKEFQKMLEENQVASVEVIQNQEAPTGSLQVLETDGSMSMVIVSDVIAAQEMLENYEVPVMVRDVEKDSIFLTTILPILLMGALLMFFFAMMNRQGGGNSRMMNFGKSRARMITPDSKRVHVYKRQEKNCGQ